MLKDRRTVSGRLDRELLAPDETYGVASWLRLVWSPGRGRWHGTVGAGGDTEPGLQMLAERDGSAEADLGGGVFDGRVGLFQQLPGSFDALMLADVVRDTTGSYSTVWASPQRSASPSGSRTVRPPQHRKPGVEAPAPHSAGYSPS
ncbi:hypothetical protein [Streptomyces sp. RPT161]|uniref:hypothetical protein n=1 Tax=Streptomyces sp. RPT161 TaxID=3015993 RepID=UPI003FCCA561